MIFRQKRASVSARREVRVSNKLDPLTVPSHFQQRNFRRSIVLYLIPHMADYGFEKVP